MIFHEQKGGDLVKYNNSTIKNKILNGMRSNVELYRFFYDNVLAYVCGKTHWKGMCSTSLGTKIANVGDEAFALLLVENSWDCWVERYMRRYKRSEFGELERADKAAQGNLEQDPPAVTPAEGGTGSDDSDERRRAYRKRRITAPVYTVQDGGGRDEEGWCPEAIERYNELRVKVRADRIAQSAFDVNYLAWKKELEEGKRKSRRANAEEP